MINEKILEKLAPITDEEKIILAGTEKINRSIYMTENKNVINSKKLLEEGKLITIRPHTRFIDFPEHTHDYVEVVYMCSGTSVHIVDGDVITLKAGELLFLSCGTTHSIKKTSENDIAINFIILPAFFDKSLIVLEKEETPLKNFILDALTAKTSNIKYLYFKVANVLPIQNLLENLLYTLTGESSNKRQLNKITFGLLLLQLTDFSEQLSVKNKSDAFILEIYRYVEENYINGSLSDLSKQLKCDFYWLSREIKNLTGETFTELIQKKRLSQASFLLKTTQININDIANSVGYENVSYFHRIFAKRFGVSPRTYRNGFFANKDTFL